jgi:hypothetical protein
MLAELANIPTHKLIEMLFVTLVVVNILRVGAYNHETR